MSLRPPHELAGANADQAIHLGEGVWWVGHRLEGDRFQCHSYLIDHGDQSVLFDPGSRLTFPHTREKIEQVLPFDRIRYFVCHHQDPDITGALPEIAVMARREDAVLVTHGRAAALLKHLDLPLPFWCVEEHGWELDLGGRCLEFIFTPYLHFPGAFCTFDRRSGVLFSSDLFGAFTDEWRLVAGDESYFEAMRPFHEHYMPSREILGAGLDRFADLPVELIAPQHGSLIPAQLIAPIVGRLRQLECGLFLEARGDTDVHRLSRMSSLLRRATRTLALARDFAAATAGLLPLLAELMPAVALDFLVTGEDGEPLQLGQGVAGADAARELLGKDRVGLEHRLGSRFPQIALRRPHPGPTAEPGRALIIPLSESERGTVEALAVVALREEAPLGADEERLLEELRPSLEVVVQRERVRLILELERQRFYERAIRDPLTGLYTRLHMRENIQRFIDLQDREPGSGVAVVMFDVDLFKEINDRLGHLVGDQVLRSVAQVIRQQTRTSDLAVRFGGDEFAVVMVGHSAAGAATAANRIVARVAQLELPHLSADRHVTLSAGVAVRRQLESLDDLLSRADAALYEAKRSGRNRTREA